MNLLARILSHGFAIAIVLLLAIGLIYRGELFPDWELPEFLTLGTQTESDRTDTPAAESPAATGETAASDEQPVPEYEEAAAGDTEMPAYIPPAEDAETPETAVPAEIPETGDAPGGAETPEAAEPPEGAESHEGAVLPEAVDANGVTETTALSPGGEGSMEPETPPVTTVTETAAEALQPPAATEMPLEDTTVAPTDDAPASGIEQPAAVETSPVPQAGDQTGLSPVPAAPVAVAPEGDEAAQSLAAPAETMQYTPEPAPILEAEPASEAADTLPGTAGTTMTEAVVVPAAGDTATVDMPVAEPVAPFPEVTEEPVAGIAAPGSAKPSEENAYRILAAAREAYWLRDYATAESKYLQLLALQPDNPDGYGELGNMYFSQGQWEQSAAAYFEAGTRLVQERQLEQARQLVDVIRGLDGSQADELNALINAAQSVAP